jgi:hypothetical protein
MMATRDMAQRSPARIHFSTMALPSRITARLASSRAPRTVPCHSSLPYFGLSVSAWKAIASADSAAT